MHVVRFQNLATVADPITELLRNGAQRLMQQAVEAEVAELLSQYAGQADA